MNAIKKNIQDLPMGGVQSTMTSPKKIQKIYLE